MLGARNSIPAIGASDTDKTGPSITVRLRILFWNISLATPLIMAAVLVTMQGRKDGPDRLQNQKDDYNRSHYIKNFLPQP